MKENEKKFLTELVKWLAAIAFVATLATMYIQAPTTEGEYIIQLQRFRPETRIDKTAKTIQCSSGELTAPELNLLSRLEQKGYMIIIYP